MLSEGDGRNLTGVSRRAQRTLRVGEKAADPRFFKNNTSFRKIGSSVFRAESASCFHSRVNLLVVTMLTPCSSAQSPWKFTAVLEIIQKTYC